MQSGIILNSKLRETVKPKCKLEWGVAGDSRNRPLNQLFTTSGSLRLTHLAIWGRNIQTSEARGLLLFVCFCFYFFSIFLSSLQLLYLVIRQKLLVVNFFVFCVVAVGVFIIFSCDWPRGYQQSYKGIFGS